MKYFILLTLLIFSSLSQALEMHFPNTCKISSSFSEKGYVTLKNLRYLPFIEIDGEVIYLDNGGLTRKNQLDAYNEAADISAKIALSFGNRFEGRVVFEGREIARGFCL